ncbi:hypothetical protein NEISUBOT_04497 [Neisseria subflava NJ9703]|uniref:Uncharacterized protein n=1 Tax=Neisseria subflava NJ9703 TaxID=546268 RepID=A0A9W5IQW5_NEISU|nr:hypothetical protein NEISUBOT_04497 [Neisseria subflava NJ9703]
MKMLSESCISDGIFVYWVFYRGFNETVGMMNMVSCRFKIGVEI